MLTCPRCGEPMSGGICDNCGFPMNRFPVIIGGKSKNCPKVSAVMAGSINVKSLLKL